MQLLRAVSLSLLVASLVQAPVPSRATPTRQETVRTFGGQALVLRDGAIEVEGVLVGVRSNAAQLGTLCAGAAALWPRRVDDVRGVFIARVSGDPAATGPTAVTLRWFALAKDTTPLLELVVWVGERDAARFSFGPDQAEDLRKMARYLLALVMPG